MQDGKAKLPGVLGGGPATAKSSLGIFREEQQRGLPISRAHDANYIRPRYGTRLKPVQDIAAIYYRDIFNWEGTYNYTFVTRNFSVQTISYQRADLYEVYNTFPANVFAQFRGAAPRMINFGCRVLNTGDFDWEREWETFRRGKESSDSEPALNPRWLVTNRKILELRVDGVRYIGYIVGDSVNKTIELESGPTLTFSFLCLEAVVAPRMVSAPLVADKLKQNLTGYFVSADFRDFATRYLTTIEYSANIPDEYRAYWRDYIGWVQDNKDVKAVKDSFWKKFVNGALDFLNDPAKAMHIVQEFARSPEAGFKALGSTVIGATEAGIISGAQGTDYASMVTAMTEQGMHRRLISDMFRGDWGAASHSFIGMSRNMGRAAPTGKLDEGPGYKLVTVGGKVKREKQRSTVGKEVKSWGNAALGMGSWGSRKYFAAHPKAKNKLVSWGSGNQ